jgi:hypothetical protein
VLDPDGMAKARMFAPAADIERHITVISNQRLHGKAIRAHLVTKAQILEYNKPIATTMPAVWEVVRQQIDHLEEQAPWDK